MEPYKDVLIWKDSIPLTVDQPDMAFLEIARVVVDVLIEAIKASDSTFVEEVRDASTA